MSAKSRYSCTIQDFTTDRCGTTTDRCIVPTMDAPLTLLEQMAERDRHRTMAIRAAIGDAVDRVVANLDLGTATAAKRGRNPQFPYVPIIKYSAGGKQRTRQLRGLAYEDRTEAVARAQASIDATRRKLAEDLCRPRERALREQFGLPREPLAPLLYGRDEPQSALDTTPPTATTAERTGQQ